MSQPRFLMQSNFRDRTLRQTRLLENLNDQSHQLRLIESAVLQDDPTSFCAKVVKLDFDLLRYACFFMEQKFEEAAHHDCVWLIVETVLDPTGGNASADDWRDWLGLAPCWPRLAQACWSSVLNEVSDLVVERLKASGVEIDRKMIDEIDDLVSGLAVGDVLPSELIAQFFSEAKGDADTDGF